MSVFSFSGVYGLPTHCASAAFTSKTFEVFKEQHDIAPIIINERMRYVPWGGDNIMPYNIINFLTAWGQRQGVFSMFYVLPNAMHAFSPICTNSFNSFISAMIICLLILFYFLSPHQTF